MVAQSAPTSEILAWNVERAEDYCEVLVRRSFDCLEPEDAKAGLRAYLHLLVRLGPPALGEDAFIAAHPVLRAQSLMSGLEIGTAAAVIGLVLAPVLDREVVGGLWGDLYHVDGIHSEVRQAISRIINMYRDVAES